MIKLEIDGETVEAEEGSSIIENADRLQIPIPRFCYHHKLSVAANCRMCLVHVENSRKPMPACATPVAEGMKVWTKSKEAVAAQHAVMEFLLVNHPLDCPICDQGGECELQDVAMGYGRDYSRYDEPKRAVIDQNLGPLIATDMTRCIHCTRCVRFGEEISGQREMGATGRGENTEIGTFIEQNVDSEVSANIIDLCPVGALTSKPFRFKARTWEMRQHPGIGTHDCIGANIYLHVHNEQVMRVVPRENERLNEIWLADRDRFSYTAVLHDERIRKPMIRKQDKWHVVSWVEALKYAISGIKLISQKYGAENFGALISPSASVEEQYLLQKLMRGLGINNIDHRLRQVDFRMQEAEPLYPTLGVDFADIEKQQAILVVGGNIPKEHPNLALKLRKAVVQGGSIACINPVAYKFNFDLLAEEITGTLIKSLQQVLDVLEQKSTGTAAVNKIAHMLRDDSGDKLIILGQLALQHPRAAELKALAIRISNITGAKFGFCSNGANAAGAWISGCVPHRMPGGHPTDEIGKHAGEMLEKPLRGYLLYGVEPEFDSVFGNKALTSVSESDFVVAVASYTSESIKQIADVILPIAQLVEMTGNYINVDGIWQELRAVTKPFGESRPGWKVLRVLANMAELEGFDYTDVSQVTDEICEIECAEKFVQNTLSAEPEEINNLKRFAPVSLYAVDGTVRRAGPLQQTADANLEPRICINQNTAKYIGLADGAYASVHSGGYHVKLKVLIDTQVADQVVIINQANRLTNPLPAHLTSVEVKQC